MTMPKLAPSLQNVEGTPQRRRSQAATGAAVAALWTALAGCNKPQEAAPAAPGPIVLAPPTVAPAPAAMPAPTPATPTAAAAPVAAAAPAAAVRPAELVPGLFLPNWYGALFVKGNSWTYLRKTADINDNADGLKRYTRTITCEVKSVGTLGMGAASLVECSGQSKTDRDLPFPGGYYASRAGLFHVGYEWKSAPADGAVPLLHAPPRAASKTIAGDPDSRDGEPDSKLSVRFVTREVAGLGKVDIAESGEATDAYGVMKTLWHFAEGVGPAHYIYTNDASGQMESDELTLVEAKVAPLPPTPAAPSSPPDNTGIASAWPKLATLKVPCTDAIGQLSLNGLAGTAGAFARPIHKLPAGWLDIPSDVRPSQWAYRGKVPGSKCTMNLEASSGFTNRLGTFWGGKPGDLAAVPTLLGPPAEHIALPQGSALDVWKWSDGVLAIYMPNVAKPDYEWWVYDVAYWNANKDAELKIWQAYAHNDFASSSDVKVATVAPEAIAAAYKEATVLVPTYAKAGLRLCKFLMKNPAVQGSGTPRDACILALKSGFTPVRNEAAKLLTKIK